MFIHSDGLDELQPVAKRIAAFKAVEAGNGHALQRGDAGRGQPLAPGGQVVHLIGNVGLGAHPLDALLDADVELLFLQFDPEAAPPLQRVRLGGLAQAEDATVEVARRRFVGRGNGDLNVVDVADHNSSLEARAGYPRPNCGAGCSTRRRYG